MNAGPSRPVLYQATFQLLLPFILKSGPCYVIQAGLETHNLAQLLIPGILGPCHQALCERFYNQGLRPDMKVKPLSRQTPVHPPGVGHTVNSSPPVLLMVLKQYMAPSRDLVKMYRGHFHASQVLFRSCCGLALPPPSSPALPMSYLLL